jgi:hypothetical protein
MQQGENLPLESRRLLEVTSAIENRMLELKAECARQDLVTLRKAAAIGSPLALAAAKLRGLFDAIALSFRLLFSKGGFSKKYLEQIDQVAREQYGYLDALPSAQPGRRVGVGFGNQNPIRSESALD